MSIILNIDTALNGASVCLAREGKTFSVSNNSEQKDHAAWLHPAIASMLKQNGLVANQLDAIAVTIGPGSYTGLRVGLSAAKGLCYALQKPLITISTLKVMAFAVLPETTSLVCPMIDARRMEVFTAVYDQQLKETVPACAMVLDEECFISLLNNEKILFCGTGSKKLQTLITSPNASFSETNYQPSDLAVLSYQEYRAGNFAELAYTEPLYIKEFYSPAPKTGN